MILLAEFLKRDDWAVVGSEVKALKPLSWADHQLIRAHKKEIAFVYKTRQELNEANKQWASSLIKGKELTGKNNTAEFESHVSHCEAVISKALEAWESLNQIEGALEGCFFLETINE